MIKHLPEGEPIFDEDDLTDQSVRTMVAEIVREKILQTTKEEIPYVTAVVVENGKRNGKTSREFTARSLSNETHRKRS